MVGLTLHVQMSRLMLLYTDPLASEVAYGQALGSRGANQCVCFFIGKGSLRMSECLSPELKNAIVELQCFGQKLAQGRDEFEPFGAELYGRLHILSLEAGYELDRVHGG